MGNCAIEIRVAFGIHAVREGTFDSARSRRGGLVDDISKE